MARTELLAAIPLPVREDAGGVLRIGRTRVSLDSVLRAYDDGASAEEIAAAFPSVTLGQVHAAIGFCLENRALIDAYVGEAEEEGDRTQLEVQARFPMNDIRRRILTRREARLAEEHAQPS